MTDGTASDNNVITENGQWYMKLQGDSKVSAAPTVGKFSIENANGGAQIKSIRLIETENRPDNREDVNIDATHGEYTQ